MVEQYTLDIKKAKELTLLVQDCNFFKKEQSYLFKFNLICSTTERLETCIKYINDHMFYPKSEEDFIIFFMFLGMIYDCLKKLYTEFGIIVHRDINIFKDLEKLKGIEIVEQDKKEIDSNGKKQLPINDYGIFQYLRSLIFAHPTNTNKAVFLKRRNENQVSPWVIVNTRVQYENLTIKDNVGIRVYTDQKNEIYDIEFPFELLLKFINNFFGYIDNVILKINEMINNKNEEYKKLLVSREGSLIDIFNSIKSILETRNEDIYEVEELINIINYKTNNTKNKNAKKILTDNLIFEIDYLCNAIDNLDYECFYSSITKYLSCSSEINYGFNTGFYNYNKALESLSKNVDLRFGYDRLDIIYNNFLNKYIFIDKAEMSANEICILLKIGNYNAYYEQKNTQSFLYE